MRKTTGKYLSFITVLTVLSLVMSLFMATAAIAVVDHCPGEPGGNGDNKVEADFDGQLNDIVIDAGTTICVKASSGNTGFVVADGSTTLQEYLFNAGIVAGNGREGRNVSYYVTYPSDTEVEPISLDLLKVDDEDTALGGVSFSLTGDDYDEADTTDGDGKASFADLTAGTYTLTETANTNEGCESAGPWTVTVMEIEGSLSASMTDAQENSVAMSDGAFVIVNNCEEIIIPCTEMSGAALRDALRLAGSDVLNAQDSDGSTATSGTATLVVPEGFCDVQVSFTSYNLPGGFMVPFEDQTVFDNITSSYAPGTYNLEIDLPECNWQIDLYTGPLQADLNPSYGHVGSTLIDWAANEGNNCDDEDGKAEICHRDANANQPYGPKRIEVNYSAIDGDGESDHMGHTGPVFPGVGEDGKWGDIIPPVEGVTDGLNWTAEGQAIYNNNCQIPEDEVEPIDLDLLKTDQGDAPLGDVVFKLEGADDFSQTEETNASGEVSFTGLTEGEYTLTELENSNEGCETAGPWTVTVTEDEGVLSASMVDSQQAEVTMQDGAFVIVNECETPESPSGSISTSQDCESFMVRVFLANNVTDDLSVLVETTIPDTIGIGEPGNHYDTTGEAGNFEILALSGPAPVTGEVTLIIRDGEEVVFTTSASVEPAENCDEQTTDLDLVKVNQDDEALADVSFDLTGDENFKQEAVSDEDGNFTFTSLLEGTYTLTETANANEGCETAGPWTVVITLLNQSENDELGIIIFDDDSNELTVSEDGSFSIVNVCEEPTTPTKPTPPTKPTIPDTAMPLENGSPAGVVPFLGMLLLLASGVWIVNKRHGLPVDRA